MHIWPYMYIHYLQHEIRSYRLLAVHISVTCMCARVAGRSKIAIMNQLTGQPTGQYIGPRWLCCSGPRKLTYLNELLSLSKNMMEKQSKAQFKDCSVPHKWLPCRNLEGRRVISYSVVILQRQSPFKRYVVLFYSSGGGGGSTAAIVIFSLIGAAVASCLIYYCCCKEKKTPKPPVLHVTMGQSCSNYASALAGCLPCTRTHSHTVVLYSA